MPWAVAGAALSAAGSIGGGLLSSNAANKAAGQQVQQQANSLDFIKSVYGNSVQNFAPYIGAGPGALSALQGFYGLPGGNPGGAIGGYQNFTQTPFYQFPLQQANLATNRALAASGQIGSGGALRDLSQLNAGYASAGLGSYLSGLQGIAASGQNAAGQLGGIGVQTGPQIGSAYTNIGNAQAQGTYNSASGINSGIQNALPYLAGSQGGQTSYGGSNSLLKALSGLFSGSGGGSAGGGIGGGFGVGGETDPFAGMTG